MVYQIQASKERGEEWMNRDLLRDGRYAEYQYRRYVSHGWMPKWVPKLNGHRAVAMMLRLLFSLAICIIGGTLGALLVHLVIG